MLVARIIASRKQLRIYLLKDQLDQLEASSASHKEWSKEIGTKRGFEWIK
jgi:hypothetical protein